MVFGFAHMNETDMPNVVREMMYALCAAPEVGNELLDSITTCGQTRKKKRQMQQLFMI